LVEREWHREFPRLYLITDATGTERNPRPLNPLNT
jgi:hypothetical protein